MKSDNVRLRHLAELLRQALGLTDKKWEGQMEGHFTCEWRGTKRTGWVGIKNVRELPNAMFKPEPGEAFRILIDYPWDLPGFDVESDRQRAMDVKRRDGSFPTLCWLPRHMTPHELNALRDYAAADYLAGDKADDLLSSLSKADQHDVIEQAKSRLSMMRTSVMETLKSVYQHEVVALMSNIDARVPEFELSGNLTRFGQELLDRSFSNHPRFGVDPSSKNLQVLYTWLLEAADDPDQSAPYDDSIAKVLRGLGEPLELLELGQTRGRLRQGTRYLKVAMDLAASERVHWSRIDEELSKQFGFEPAVRNLFLGYLAQVQRFRMIRDNGEPHTFVLDAKPRGGIVLERARLLDVAAWSRARDLGSALLSVEAPSHCTVTEQDRLAKRVREAASERHSTLSDLHAHIVRLLPENTQESSTRLQAIKETLARLGQLTRGHASHALLEALLTSWPDDGGDPLRMVLKRASDMARALARLSETQRQHLLKATAHPRHGGEVGAHLAALEETLAEGELTDDVITTWNRHATELVGKLVVGPPLHQEPPSSAPPPASKSVPQPSPPPARFFHEARVDVQNADALTDFWVELKKKLYDKGGRVVIRVSVEEES